MADTRGRRRTLLVCGDGIDVDTFLTTPVRHRL